jgi:hypothetical protein
MIDTITENTPIAQEIASKVISSISEQPTIGTEHVVLAILGALLYNLMELDKLRKNKKKFNGKAWVSSNWLSMIISTGSLITMFLLKEDLNQIMGFDMTNRFGCFLAGFTVHTFTTKANHIAMKTTDGTSDNNSPAPKPDDQ